MNDKDLGLKILKAFYDYSRSEYPFGAIYSFDELKNTLESRKAGQGFIESLGMAARFAEFDDSKIYSSMRALAIASGGKIPAKNGDFYQFMVDEATSINFVDAATYTVSESAKQIVDGAVSIGDTLLSTGKILQWLFIPVVLYFGYRFLKNKTA